MDISALIQQMAIILIFMAVGVIANKTRIIGDDDAKVLSKVVIYVCQPAMILAAVMNNSLPYSNGEVLEILGLSWLFYAVMIALAYILTVPLRIPINSRGVFRFMIIFGNVAFMGYPVVASLFGIEMVFIASICTMPFNILAFSYGIILISGKKDTKIDIKSIINTSFISTLIALAIFFGNIRFPSVIYEATSTLGGMITPASMLVIGAALGSMKLREIFGDWRAYVLCVIKLLLIPLAVWALARLVVKDSDILGLFVVLAAMPAGVLASIFAIQYGGDVKTAGRGVFLTTILSIATVPLLIYILF